MPLITYQTVAHLSGKDIILFRLSGESGAYVELLNYGATLLSVYVPDCNNRLENVVLTYPDIRDYFTDKNYLGSTIGRCANRIANAQFTMDGTTYHLDRNDGQNNNHSGYSGFHQKIFDAEILDDKLILTTHSRDNEGGFPGNMEVRICFSFCGNELTIHYKALSDRATIFNPTCHAYFNLSGKKESVFQHELKVNSIEYLETDNDFIPTGRVLPVVGSAFDFGQYRFIGQMAALKQDILKGYNVYFPVPGNGKLRQLAFLSESVSGRKMTISSDMPGVMLYTGDYLDGQHRSFEGVCLEAQFYPDTPNHAHFPDCIVMPEKTYEHIIRFQFDIC